MFGIKTSQDAEQILISVQEQLRMIATEQPHRVTDAANEVEYWLGVTATLRHWEENLRNMLDYAQEQAWDDDRVTIGKYQLLTRLLLKSADDKWSGRGNDGKRSHHDGCMEALSMIETDLRFITDKKVDA